MIVSPDFTELFCGADSLAILELVFVERTSANIHAEDASILGSAQQLLQFINMV